ncbi:MULTISPECIES: DUF1707 SHOCT-like domain-containing protein [Rhodococcus]|uniref:Uncharacterized protein DUF1707 n=1 Tax=Rhodococcus rhodochrous J45 TaxID=935266 RepID=A0A562D7I6_RHORH|nr:MULTISPECIES: DUF1707 domain-containing protein [Rhodococcus]OWY82090.1 hypothetical protein B9C99_09715 [Rhodococcus sp. BUPNP1]QHG82797.1 DUF1707 domain-containing protein [Rhodococcus rhodochrous]QOH57522.1 DUF1707 domain-containing protein [Rhodococcus rhodochrous]TWH05703.1 uncharacterized protein DUF1707 [Rhodococcus rhodochrous J45]WAL45135.1 DUF1707 domain-containing protein [Rhodococcus pyridinivorans]
MADRPDIRIGTAEREEAVALLGEHFAAGRLSLAEFDERVALATQATVRGDLIPLFADLPSAPAAMASTGPRDLAEQLLTLVPFILVALLVIVVFRHPIALLIAFGVLFVAGRRAYRLLGEGRGPS